SPLSFLSRSPTPTSADDSSLLLRKPYPSPPSSQSNTGSPMPPDAMASAEQRPAKRRKTEPKPRTTLSLDLRADYSIDEQKPQLERLLRVLHKKRKIVVIAGAGISVSAGIPDFRSSTGLFKSLKNEHNLKSSGKDLFDASVYKDDISTATFHAMVRNLSQATKTAEPTSFHHMLATLANEGRLLRLYSQNVDGIDTSLPPLATRVPLTREEGAWPKTVQLHGGLDKMVCVKCHKLSDFEPELFDGPVPPTCKACEAQDNVRTEHAGKRSHGIGKLRPRMVLYNEHNPDEEAIGSITRADLRSRPDAVIIVGTTLKVPGVRRIAREMCSVVRDRRDGLTVWINNDNPPIGKDLEWDLIVKGPCDEVARHAAMRKWDDVFEAVTDEDMRKAREAGEAKVIIESPAKSIPFTFEQVCGVPTPAASPKLPAKTTKQPISTAEKKSSTTLSGFTIKSGAKKAPSKPKATGPPKAAAPKRKRAPAKKTEAKNPRINQTFKVSK
ncbi:DHS-like NAD/FAD-binding domain-containing protein, partial [Rhizodiscina lignyota]